jgi:hypothetical protein
MNLKMMEQAFEEDRKRLQTGYRVFVSYSSIDEQVAQSICGILTELGIEFFFDRKDIHWGQEVVPGISGGLRSCTHLIVVVSPASLKSSWVSFEIGQATAFGKTILPFLLHPLLDVPDFIRQYHYKTRLDEIRDFFSNPLIDQDELEKLYGIVMSRLPEIRDYSYCAEESTPETDIWRTNSAMRSPWGGDNCLYGRIEITGSGQDASVKIDCYREKRDREAGWHDRHTIIYDSAQQSIMATDRCEVLEYAGRCTDRGHTWVASATFWIRIVEMLRSRLPTKPSVGTALRTSSWQMFKI